MAFLSLLIVLSLFAAVHCQPSPPKGFLIDCGATVPSVIDNRQWLPDGNYVSVGVPKTVSIPGLLPTLSTLRSFPLLANAHRKFCYVVPAYRGAKYLVRTTYFYGGVNGVDSPPVFDQIVDGTVWSVVNTTDDYANGMSSYYEGVFVAKTKTMSVCVAQNTYTKSDPFISALELLILGDSVYNSTDFVNYGLSLVARHTFGYGGPIIKFPDDQFDRYWEPFGDSNPTIQSIRNVSASGFWNLPPEKIFDTALMSKQTMELQWPPGPLLNDTYYIALYFADNGNASQGSSRVLNITVNGIEYYRNLKVTPFGAVVFATKWPLSGQTKIILTPAAGSDVGPLINAGEIFGLLSLGGRTITRDVIALERVRNNLQNTPLDWSGDPCFPREYSWTGVSCSDAPQIRIVALNLSSMGLSGSLSPSIAKLTALTDIWFGNNNLSGPIPDLSPLRILQTLHLEVNQFSGEVPPSLGNITGLRELFIENNNLTGQIPDSLKTKPGLNLKTSPGNNFLLPSPPPAA
ncbi:putative leucine-rich repeat receptor-like serine/threonine-protein kinase At2g14440 isoform X1 [Macadamia integrifolia]|uniref:putative leucine-rich repeat receptor-like serine/threonine-protein kinase At2g14440 isoform X1 n=2 Tax=Macadamia integrifolia TaxID=60698 RepID=UPI001C4F484B|nr:putative leucine-rich repeat receptor-like serine/threonine-protein kinase At2g14440 isoform X1 [Macadamia integrifolia]